MHGNESIIGTLDAARREENERARGTFIVAECGINWRDLSEAKKLIEIFGECGANACKFQMYEAEQVSTHPRAKELQSIVVTEDWAKELIAHGRACDTEVFFTPMYPDAVEMLKRLNVTRIKVRSKDATNADLLGKILATKKEVMVSVAGDRLDWDTLEEHGYRYKTRLLYCISKYPAKDDEVHLKNAFPAMRSYISSVDYSGLSDHTTGITCPVAAVAMGAMIIEKHVMLDRKFDWIDAPVSITPLEFKEMAHHIRRTEVLRR